MRSSFSADQVEAAPLDAADHLADEAALHAVGFDEHQGAFDAHGAQV